MKLTILAPNMTQLENGKFTILFSYNTPVAAINTDTGVAFKTNEFHSRTTNAHISKWASKHGFTNYRNIASVSQTEIEGMAS